MPLAALVDRLAPPARAVDVRAAANEPTVRTVDGLSTRKSAGSGGAVVAVAAMPRLSKFCEYGEPVGIAIAADRTAASRDTSATTASARTNRERMKTTSGLQQEW